MEECIDQTAGTRSADYLRFLAEAEMRAADPDEYLDMDDSDVDDFEAVPGRNAAVSTCAGVHLEDSPMSPSAKRACEIPPPVCRIPTQPDIEMGTVPLPVPEDAMEVDFDLEWSQRRCEEVQRESVRRGRNVLIKPTWKYVQTLLVSAATVTQFELVYLSIATTSAQAQLRVVTDVSQFFASIRMNQARCWSGLMLTGAETN